MKVVKKITAVLLSVLLLFSTFSLYCFADDTATESETETNPTSTFLNELSAMVYNYDNNSFGFSSGEEIPTCRIIVKTKNNTEITDYQGAIDYVSGLDSMYILQYSTETGANEALSFYQAQDYVEYAEMDRYVTCSSVASSNETAEESNGDYLSWGTSATKIDVLHNTISNSNLNTNEVVVAIFDSGLDAHGHNDPDRIYEGVNVIDGTDDTSDGMSSGHGTHVAGIILDNTLSNVKIKPYKINQVYNGDLQTALSLFASSIKEAVNQGDDVINISMDWGEISSSVDDAIDYAYDRNVPIVVAAGNADNDYGNDADYVYPALNEKVITVAAIDKDFEIMLNPKCGKGSSNYGTCVDISAPGCNIYSTVRGYGFGWKCGTSMAAPFVTSAVAMIKSVYPDISCDVIVDILKSNAYVPEEWDNTKYGAGILDCSNIIPISKTPKPTVSFTDDGEVQLKTTSSSATIYYTLDKSEPIIGVSSIYAGPINTKNVSAIKAIAYEVGKLPSDILEFDIKWTEDVDMYYKQTVTFDELKIPPNAKILSAYSSNEEVVTVDKYDRKIYASGVGEAKVHIYLENNRKITVNVEAEYNIIQWLIIVVLWGFLWYI